MIVVSWNLIGFLDQISESDEKSVTLQGVFLPTFIPKIQIG